MTAEPDLVAALRPVADALDRLDAPYQVGGSVASSAHGMARSTMDVDLVADLRTEHVQEFVAALGGDYYVDEEVIREALRRRESFNLIHIPTMLKIDVFPAKGRPYDRQALARRRRERLDADPASREFFVATAEDVVLAKLEWFDRGGRVSERQWSDILGVLRVQGDALDLAYMRRWAADLGVADLLQRALDER